MPELAEVDHSRRQWNAGLGAPIREVFIARPEIRVFRGTDAKALRRALAGRVLSRSEANGKQMVFHFDASAQDGVKDKGVPQLWLGVHLGMRGELRVENGPDFKPGKHDHLVLRQDERALVFEDQRHFGRILFHAGSDAPDWWSRLAPSVLSDKFSRAALAEFLRRRRRTPIKATLLMQERFPGVGNWMADEILWRARLHPAATAGTIAEDAAQLAALHKQTQWVARTAMEVINDDWTYPPSWLFLHRWEPGGYCPRRGCRAALERATIGGRTTCWCPSCQISTR